MARIQSDTQEMLKAFKYHFLASNVMENPSESRFISLFYASECGLKFLFMSNEFLTTTDQLYDSLRAKLGVEPKESLDMHDIERLCIAASMSPVDTGVAPSNFEVRGKSFRSYKMHEAIRYGVNIPGQAISAVEAWLVKITGTLSESFTARGL